MSGAELLARARAAQRSGGAAQAISAYLAALAQDPACFDAAFELAVAFQSTGDTQKAIDAFRRAIAIDPSRPEPYLNAGVLHHARGEIEAAIADLTAAAARSPADPTALINLGRVHLAQSRSAEAERAFADAAALAPEAAAAHFWLGAALRATRPLDAVTALRRALELDPRNAEFRYELAQALAAAGMRGEAAAEAEEAGRLSPQNPAVARLRLFLARLTDDQAAAERAASDLVRLGIADVRTAGEILEAAQDTASLEPARAALLHFLRTRPNDPAGWRALARDAHGRAQYEECMDVLDRGIAATGDSALRLFAAVTLPKIPLSNAQVDFARAATERHLDEILADPVPFANPHKHVGKTPFVMAYQGRNDRALQTKVARAHLAACPELAWTAPHCRARRSPRAKTRIGFFSAFLKNHAVGRLIANVIRDLDRGHFEVCIIRPPNCTDAYGAKIDSFAERVLTVPTVVEEARRKIAELELDVLFFTDIGMEAFTYYLACARLARTQLVWPGHPVTTGLPEIDIFVSSQLTEPDDANDHYSERLFRLESLPIYESSRVLDQVEGRGIAGLPPGPLYVCPMTTFKLQPDMDIIFEEIIRRDPRGTIVVVAKETPWDQAMLRRVRESAPSAAERLHVLPHLPYQHYLELLAAADVVLDSVHFGGGNTSRDAIGLAAPMVTLRGKFLRSRTTAGMYRRMGVSRLTVESSAAYADLSARLANDRMFREDVVREIQETRHAIFEDRSVLKEYHDLFLSLAR